MDSFARNLVPELVLAFASSSRISNASNKISTESSYSFCANNMIPSSAIESYCFHHNHTACQKKENIHLRQG
jgi:hypothetical protein